MSGSRPPERDDLVVGNADAAAGAIENELDVVPREPQQIVRLAERQVQLAEKLARDPAPGRDGGPVPRP